MDKSQNRIMAYLIISGNCLQAVYDNATNQVFGKGMEFKNGANETVEYEYDRNGNLTKDLNKKISDIQYNILNLPSLVLFEDGNSISYIYDANGMKIQTRHIIENDTTVTEYIGSAIYENGVLTKLLTNQGYITLADTIYHYYIQDHQGNNRAIVTKDGTVEESNHYYPLGGLFTSTSNVQPYKYNGKELDRRSGMDWYKYGARAYDAVIGRFNIIDPLAEIAFSVNPYSYCLNNPFNRVDPTGMVSHYNWNKERYEDKKGNEVSWNSVQQEYGIENNNKDNSESEQTMNNNSPISPEVNSSLTPWGNAASLHAGLKYTKHPFRGGYFRTKKGEIFLMDIFHQSEGTKLARKAKGLVNSVQGAKNATKAMRGLGNAIGGITIGISVYNFKLNPNI